MIDIKTLVRPNIAALKPYKSARSEYQGNCLLLDANENPFGNGTDNRYPDPYQSELRQKLATRSEVEPAQILFGNGSDELIDMLIRVFCQPGKESLVVCPPTFGMYEVQAQINDVTVKKINLKEDYQLEVDSIIKTEASILFLPCPNAPTGNLFQIEDLELILKNFKGLVVLDEAYVDFATTESWTKRLQDFPNLIVLQTFSKYWALAGCRIGMMFASSEIIEIMSTIKMPYNLNNLSAQKAIQALENESEIRKNADILGAEIHKLQKEIAAFKFVLQVFPTQTNFIWMEVKNAQALKKFLEVAGIIIRGYKDEPQFLRISVGTPQENKKLMDTLKNYTS